MNWVDEGALYSQIALFLREDMGRGDLTTQSIVARNTRARGRFVAGERMIVAGLEAAEEVFLTLDTQQQLEAFVADGEEIDAGKVIARMSGFADVLLAGERVALNLIRHLSSVATMTNQFVKAVDGTSALIVDTRQMTPGLRMLEKYAVQLGGGQNHRFGLDDGVVIKSSHIAFAGGLESALVGAKEKLGHLHRIEIQVNNEEEVQAAIENGADILLLEDLELDQMRRLIATARERSPNIAIECSGAVTLDNVRDLAEAGATMIGVASLTAAPRQLDISFQIQPF